MAVPGLPEVDLGPTSLCAGQVEMIIGITRSMTTIHTIMKIESVRAFDGFGYTC